MKRREKPKTSRTPNSTLEARGTAAWLSFKSSYRPCYSDYYRAKFGELIEQTVEKAKAGDDDALLQLIEWDKSYLSERFVSARIAIAESYCIEVNNPKKVREQGKHLLQRLSNAVKKVAQLPKIKKHWGLLCWLRQEAQGRSIEELADYTREQWRASSEESAAEGILADKRAVLVRFIETHKHFIRIR